MRLPPPISCFNEIPTTRKFNSKDFNTDGCHEALFYKVNNMLSQLALLSLIFGCIMIAPYFLIGCGGILLGLSLEEFLDSFFQKLLKSNNRKSYKIE